ncbi:MAG: tRNA pseudouridine(55) synthase TruB [Synergistaceae bacterium]|jgi:tRNA pseudouridine(55) synthase|nr:tRNA pseudouridine(55) synthase TruB [Synergistaceae bacterium]
MFPPGFLPINKPIGLRSSSCVELAKKMVGRNVKVGHGGTLDSSASGVLILLFAGATRLSSFIMRMPKTYNAVVRLGSETTTCDYTGEITDTGDWKYVSESDIDRALLSFLGWRMQTPPKVSAVHVNGRRAHEVFRRGDDPDIKPRMVFVKNIRRTTPLSRDGEFSLTVNCGKGTYIRSLANDIGRMLGCCAHITALKRERVGYFSLTDSLDPGEDFSISREDLLSAVQPVSTMRNFLPCYGVSSEDILLLLNGRGVPLSRATRLTYGESAPRGLAVIASDSLMSITRLEMIDGHILLMPEVNIQIPAQTQTTYCESAG